ncbi:hypothetical protein F441_09501 [Phytophthora nicotianae CJ01A1]|uniref:Uncharacterized protein n=5 Tax=Phytophthora nicotianae TaxID=4792 RepID=V9F399_PHYNI|nr:hypothetical protein F443_09570 [Phytophthora nicotianae P1569]ETK85963.1 hypothetical protein L915_09363 [Phytophthora nicotianae]ETO80224.1 hypothetical protein F444_05203 [Phytophthora nicotianae P1976]ETP15751.1 hypothetical protein F441_09501 [Phytophthora nicotianae CJ01A1]ETP43880.1 hypothetical protein F442_09475 [Phytophthora nicotianae P10297]
MAHVTMWRHSSVDHAKSGLRLVVGIRMGRTHGPD